MELLKATAQDELSTLAAIQRFHRSTQWKGATGGVKKRRGTYSAQAGWVRMQRIARCAIIARIYPQYNSLSNGYPGLPTPDHRVKLVQCISVARGLPRTTLQGLKDLFLPKSSI